MTRLSEAELWFAYGQLVAPDAVPDQAEVLEEFACERIEIGMGWCPRHLVAFEDECPGEREAVG